MDLPKMDNIAPPFEGQELIAGVRIFNLTGDEIALRVARSDGTGVAGACDYEEGMRVPRRPGQPLRTHEMRSIRGEASTFTRGSSVAIVRVPDELAVGINRTNLFRDLVLIEPEIKRFAAMLS